MAGDAPTQTDDERPESSSVVSLSLADLVFRAALPLSRAVTIPTLGHVTVSLEHRQIRSEQVANFRVGCHGIALSLSGSHAILWVEKGLARLAVDLLLGRQTSWGPPTLSRIERGLFHGIVAGIAAAACVPDAINIDGVAETVAWPALVARVRVDIAGATGRAWLCVSADFLAALLKASLLESVLAIELASTVVPRMEVASVAVGDAVVFDESSATSAVRLRAGGQTAGARLCADGRLAALEIGTTGDAVTKDDRRPTESSPGGVEVTAEATCLAGADLAAFIEKPILGNSQRVLLRREGAPWAEGDITSFDGRLAVRLTRLSAR